MYDILAEFDLLERRHPESGQFFCGLLVECSWEPLLEWVNTRLGANSWLYFYEDKDRGFAMVLLKPQSPDECHRPWEQEINCLEQYFLAAVPVRVPDK